MLWGTPAPIYAATITVNTTDDELNEDGDCSLREAIQAANTDGAADACASGLGDDTIIVPSGIYILTLDGALDDENLRGDLDITDDVVIIGEDPSTTVIDAGGID